MRWFVEISALGQGGGSSSTVCVEAPQWQPALQRARALRGDDSAFANFSIELLDDGFRAIDPASRLKYVVRRAPDDAKLTDGAPAKTNGEAKRSASSAPPPATAKSAAMGGPRPPQTPHAEPMSEAPKAKRSSDKITIPHDKPPPPPVVTRSEPPRPDPSLPSFEVVRERAEQPSEKSPLVYREIAYAVAKGTSDAMAGRLAIDRLEALKHALAGERAGKLVNLAIFDHAFTTKPKGRPIVTLTWKDWKGEEPEIRYPRHEADEAAVSAARSYPPPAAAPPVAPPPAQEPASGGSGSRLALEEPASGGSGSRLALEESASGGSGSRLALEESASGGSGSRLAPENPASERTTDVSGPPAGAVDTSPTVPSAREEEVSVDVTLDAVTATPEPAIIHHEAAPAMTPVAHEKPAFVSEPPPPPPPPAPASPTKPSIAKRLAGEDLLVELFEACSDLHFLADPFAGADFVLQLMLEKLPTEIGIVSLFDIDKREFVVVKQVGGRSLINHRTKDKSPIVEQAMRSSRSAVVADATRDERLAKDERWEIAGVRPRSFLCAPAVVNGRYLGTIELANPLDGAVFTDADGHALTYLGQQFGEFVAALGVNVDPEAIRASAAPPAPAKKRR